MKLGLTFIAALLAKSATPSLAKGTRRVAAAAEEPAPAVAVAGAGVDQPDAAAAAGSKRGLALATTYNFGQALDKLAMEIENIHTDYGTCMADGQNADVDHSVWVGAGLAKSCQILAMIRVQQAVAGWLVKVGFGTLVKP